MLKNRVRIQYVSDLHLNEKLNFKFRVCPDSKYLALAGDIGDPKSKEYENLLKFTSREYDQVFLITGNHEYPTLNDVEKIDNLIQEIALSLPNVHFLNKRSYATPEFTIVGNTLWSRTLNDNAHLKLFMKSRDDLLLRLGQAKTYAKHVVAVTHHMPNRALLSKYFTEHPVWGRQLAYYASNLNVSTKLVDTWIYGHTHEIKTSVINDVRFGVNAVGRKDKMYLRGFDV